jgi:hypothetical protein
MMKIRSVAGGLFTLSIGALVLSCGSFSASHNAGVDASVGPTGTGGTPSGGGGSAGGSQVGTGGSTGSSTGGSQVGTGTGGAPGSGGTQVSNGDGATSGPTTPCDILAAAAHPCVAAHSTTRVLNGGYTGPLYQVCRGASAPGPNSCPGGIVMDIGAVAGGYADAAAQDAFCGTGACTISIIYDQTPNKNDLRPAPGGGAKASPDNPVNAADLRITMNGHAVYGVFVKSGMGYRAGCTGCGVVVPKGTAINDDPETEYMVTTPNGLVDQCCFDYGNAETDSRDDGDGTMEALYFGGGVVWGTGFPGGHGNGPWVMADLENGLYAGWENNQDQNISTNTPMRTPFITGMLVGDVAAQNNGMGRFALYGGNATMGGLKTLYDGIRPAKPGYVPMQKQGSIILGIGGDNSDTDGGQWFEGVMASGAATVQTLSAVQANIVAAGYGK